VYDSKRYICTCTMTVHVPYELSVIMQWGWLELIGTAVKDVWKCSTTELGEQFVMTVLLTCPPQLSATSSVLGMLWMSVGNNGKTKWFNKLDECENSRAVIAHFTRNNNTLSAIFKDSLSMKICNIAKCKTWEAFTLCAVCLNCRPDADTQTQSLSLSKMCSGPSTAHDPVRSLTDPGIIGVNFVIKVGTHGERWARAYNRGLGQSLQRGQGAEPWSVGQGTKPPWSWKHFVFPKCRWCANLPIFVTL